MDFTIDQVRAICDAVQLPVGIPFIDNRLEEYQAKFAGGYPYYAALRDLVRELEPHVVLEIGSWQGTSAAAFAAGSEETTVITIDHHSDPGDDQNQAKTIEACNLFPNLNYVQGCSSEMVHLLKEGTINAFPIIKEFLGENRIDILFIDGWHGGEFARADFDTYRPLLAPNALIICDDLCEGDSAAIFGMKQFWEGLPGEKYLCHNLHGSYPMGFIKLQGE